MVPEAGLEPASLTATDFLTTLAFAIQCGLDYAFTFYLSAFRWEPSSLYTFPISRASLGVGIPLKAIAFTEFGSIQTIISD